MCLLINVQNQKEVNTEGRKKSEMHISNSKTI